MKPDRLYRGFSLVEVTLALGVAAVSLITVFGLLATGIQTHQTSVEESASSDLLAAVAADLRATPRTTPPGGATTSLQFGISIPANPVNATTSSTLYFDAAGSPSASLNASSVYRLTIKFVANGSGTRTATFIDLQMTWPAAADPASAKTRPTEAFVALDRN